MNNGEGKAQDTLPSCPGYLLHLNHFACFYLIGIVLVQNPIKLESTIKYYLVGQNLCAERWRYDRQLQHLPGLLVGRALETRLRFCFHHLNRVIPDGYLGISIPDFGVRRYQLLIHDNVLLCTT